MVSDSMPATGYPPQPWHLRGDLHASVFLVPVADVPVEAPPGWRPVRFGRHGVVITAWVSYVPGGVLTYRELMATLLVRRGWRILPTVTHIWVDSEPSRAGGRELWGIPKELAAFDFSGERFAASGDDGPIATATVRRLGRLPCRLPVRFRLVQTLGGAATTPPVRARGRLAVDRARFRADPAGPLAFLAERRALVSVTLSRFRMIFGSGAGAVCTPRRWITGARRGSMAP